MTITKSDYDFKFNENENVGKILQIYDLDRGGMSVTNDMRNVVKAIFERYPDKDESDYIIIYQDSMGMFDAWEDGRFIPIQKTTIKEAVEFYNKTYKS